MLQVIVFLTRKVMLVPPETVLSYMTAASNDILKVINKHTGVPIPIYDMSKVAGRTFPYCHTVKNTRKLRIQAEYRKLEMPNSFTMAAFAKAVELLTPPVLVVLANFVKGSLKGASTRARRRSNKSARVRAKGLHAVTRTHNTTVPPMPHTPQLAQRQGQKEEEPQHGRAKEFTLLQAVS
jgi:hypothetical protein